MKRNKIIICGIAATILTIAAGITFQGCQKDPIESAKDAKIKGANAGGINLQEFEIYAPDESTVDDKLSQLMNCVNDPGTNPMENIELKEAVWFLEAFFNAGVCSHQEHAMKYVVDTKKYVIRVPVESWSIDNNIVLNGGVLQTKYISLLDNIISDLCGEYAINFGDMYVDALYPATNEVDLALTALYGIKSHKVFGFTKIASPQNYPTLTSPIVDWFTPYPLDLPIRDFGMEALLNQEPLSVLPLGLIRYTPKFLDNLIPVYTEGVISYAIHLKQLHDGAWNQYGTSYRDCIYNNLSAYHDLLPYDNNTYAPLYAMCFVDYRSKPQGNFIGEAYHRFGLEYIQQIVVSIGMYQCFYAKLVGDY